MRGAALLFPLSTTMVPRPGAAHKHRPAIVRREVRELTALVPRVYLPAFLATLGEAMLVVTLPLYLRELGMSFTLLSVVLAAAGVGALAFNVPAGVLIARWGDRDVMLWGVGVLAVSSWFLAVVTGSVVLVAVRFVAGIGMVSWLLSRQTFMFHEVRVGIRGRAMSVLGGLARAAHLIGPAAGGFLATRLSFQASFVVAGAVAACGVLTLLGSRRNEVSHVPPDTRMLHDLTNVVRDHAGVLLKTGFAQLCTATIRHGRFVVLPLYGASLGLDAAQIGIVMSLSSGLDLVLFPMSGYLMDRFGRLYAIVPAFTMMGIALALVPLAHGFGSLVLVGLGIGLGNGLSAGTMLTLSTDLAPQRGPSEFLGALGLLRDIGKVAAPVIAGTIADAFSLGTAAVVLGAVGVLGAISFVVLVGETHTREVPVLQSSDGIPRMLNPPST